MLQPTEQCGQGEIVLLLNISTPASLQKKKNVPHDNIRKCRSRVDKRTEPPALEFNGNISDRSLPVAFIILY